MLKYYFRLFFTNNKIIIFFKKATNNALLVCLFLYFKYTEIVLKIRSPPVSIFNLKIKI